MSQRIFFSWSKINQFFGLAVGNGLALEKLLLSLKIILPFFPEYEAFQRSCIRLMARVGKTAGFRRVSNGDADDQNARWRVGVWRRG